MNNTYRIQGDMYQDLKSSLNDVELLNNLDGKTCKYYDIDEFQTKFKNNSDNFSVFSLNIRSLTGKLNEFQEFISELNYQDFNFSVVSIQETWDIPIHLNTDMPGYKPLIFKTIETILGEELDVGLEIFTRPKIKYHTLKINFLNHSLSK